MDDLNFNHLRKKKFHIGFRVSKYEKEQIDEFCQREEISKADFLRHVIGKILTNKPKK